MHLRGHISELVLRTAASTRGGFPLHGPVQCEPGLVCGRLQCTNARVVRGRCRIVCSHPRCCKASVIWWSRVLRSSLLKNLIPLVAVATSGLLVDLRSEHFMFGSEAHCIVWAFELRSCTKTMYELNLMKFMMKPSTFRKGTVRVQYLWLYSGVSLLQILFGQWLFVCSTGRVPGGYNRCCVSLYIDGWL